MAIAARDMVMLVASFLVAILLMYISIAKDNDLERRQIDEIIAQHTITVF